MCGLTEPLSQAHHLAAESLSELWPAEMQTAYFHCMERDPGNLLASIEAKVARRGLLRHATTFR
jgi:hypothetical protein